ncbi:MAG: alpha-mannosidase [Tissierella sp.]|nr:alpha-mannosidase [Tissierella sp.]
MYFSLQRIQKICDELKDCVYEEHVAIEDFKFTVGNFLSVEEANKAEEWRDYKAGDLWGGKDYHSWMKTSVIIPEHFQGKNVAVRFFSDGNGWNASNPQFILYVNEKLIQGLDINHSEVILSESANAGQEYKVDLHAYSGTLSDKKSIIKGTISTVNLDTRKLYFNLQVPIWVCEKLDSEDKRRIEMLQVLNDAVNIIDLRKPYSKDYYDSIKKANDYLEIEFYEKLCGHDEVIATCVGHTHIDVAWQWTVAQTREKVARSFSTVLNLMDQYPEYVFMSSQPVLYKFLKEDYPELYEKVKERVREGRWEPEGSMWVEPDCNVTSGESLVRQLLYGKRFFKEEFDVDTEVLWLPDVFGYSAALPQILKKSDVNYFMTIKISWNQFNKMPYDTFMWRGIDGTEILTHFMTTRAPYHSPESHSTTYNGQIHPGAIIGAWDRYQQKNLSNDVLVAYGYGDGGGGPTFEMLEVAKRMEKGIPGSPKVNLGNSLDYFKKLEKTVEDNKELPKWVGELYLEYHRGTYTSMGKNKRDNRLCENLYTSLEKLSILGMELGKEYPQRNINSAWETILLNQFHDILPGTSIKEVYEVTEEEYKNLLVNGRDMMNNLTNHIASNINIEDDSVVVFNPGGYIRNDIVEFDYEDNLDGLVVVDGNVERPCQRIEDGKYIFYAENLPANGYKTFKLIKSNTKFENINLTERNAENKFFNIKFDDKGQIESLVDKRVNREILKDGERANVLQAFEDKPMNWDCWDIDIYYKEKMWLVDDVESLEVTEVGPVRSTLRIIRNFVDSQIIQDIHIYNDIDKIDFAAYVDWKQHQVLLKAAFPVDLNTSEATYEIQYGNVTRSTHNNTSWDVAQFETCGQRWVDLSEGDYGVSLLNDSKYGHDIKDGLMRLTLIKSGISVNPISDREEHRFKYSLYPHKGTWKESETVSMGYNINTPLLAVVEGQHDGSLDNEFSIANVVSNKENVIIEAMKKAEDDDSIIVRMYEYKNMRSKVKFNIFKDIVSVTECNLMERDMESVDFEGNSFEFDINPYEIKTFKINL